MQRLKQFGDGGMGDVSAACREAHAELSALYSQVAHLLAQYDPETQRIIRDLAKERAPHMDDQREVKT